MSPHWLPKQSSVASQISQNRFEQQRHSLAQAPRSSEGNQTLVVEPVLIHTVIGYSTASSSEENTTTAPPSMNSKSAEVPPTDS